MYNVSSGHTWAANNDGLLEHTFTPHDTCRDTGGKGRQGASKRQKRAALCRHWNSQTTRRTTHRRHNPTRDAESRPDIQLGGGILKETTASAIF